MIIDYKKATICQLDGTTILSDVDFQVHDGEFVYIIGRVGSGKSSLLKTIYQELYIDEAEQALVFDHNLLTLKRRHVPALRRQMGIVFQDFQLLADRSVRRNLMFVLKATGWKGKASMNDRIDEVLTLVDMDKKADRMPHELSGGEQQRIALARAILNSPKLIVADEPTANLDAETAKGIMDLLRSFADEGTAIVMSTHNTALLDLYPGTVYRCEDGHLAKEKEAQAAEEEAGQVKEEEDNKD